MIQGNIEEMISSEGLYIGTTVGISMRPLFKDRRDNVLIRPINGKLKKYDVPLYKRGDRYILHRIIKITENGYVIRGDNCDNCEFDITDEKIVGVLKGAWRKDKYFSVDNFFYKVYSRLIVFCHPLRTLYKRCRYYFLRIIKRG